MRIAMGMMVLALAASAGAQEEMHSAQVVDATPIEAQPMQCPRPATVDEVRAVVDYVGQVSAGLRVKAAVAAQMRWSDLADAAGLFVLAAGDPQLEGAALELDQLRRELTKAALQDERRIGRTFARLGAALSLSRERLAALEEARSPRSQRQLAVSLEVTLKHSRELEYEIRLRNYARECHERREAERDPRCPHPDDTPEEIAARGNSLEGRIFCLLYGSSCEAEANRRMRAESLGIGSGPNGQEIDDSGEGAQELRFAECILASAAEALREGSVQ